MKTIERPPETSPAQAEPVPVGHIGRVTALSMSTGAVAALALGFFVLDGGTEPVVTGAVLLAFALSWWMLAVLSTRRTDQPQRWARVPAAIMAVLGVAALALRPSAAAMDAIGWVWPLGLVVLAVWMIGRSRRSLHSWSRGVVLGPIFALMIAGGIGGTYETVREAQERSAFAMPGDLVDVGTHRLHIHCTGTGSPTVVLEDGLGETSVRMAAQLAPSVAAVTRVCVYDRAGRGWSDPAPEGQDGLSVVTDLHALLDRHGEHGPYVLAGHSSGGVYVQAYAARYPDEVAGLALIDAQPATALTALPDYPPIYAGFHKLAGVAPTAARFGVMRLLYLPRSGDMPDPAPSQEAAFGSSASHNRSYRDEVVALPDAMRQAQRLTTIGDKPLVVVTAEQDASTGWLPLQAQLVRLSTNSVQRSLPDAAHASLIDDSRFAPVSAAAITDVVRSVRANAPVPAT